MPTEYLTQPFTMHHRPVPRYGPWGLIRGQSPTGYGNKIPTDYMIRVPGSRQPKRLRRVWCICHSNIGSAYIILDGRRVFTRTLFQDECIPI